MRKDIKYSIYLRPSHCKYTFWRTVGLIQIKMHLRQNTIYTELHSLFSTVQDSVPSIGLRGLLWEDKAAFMEIKSNHQFFSLRKYSSYPPVDWEVRC